MDEDNKGGKLWSATGGWVFMQEPLWRWFVFMLAIGLITTAWNSTLRHMRTIE